MEEKLYRIKTKENAHINQKVKPDGAFVALQFDEENGLQGPVDLVEVSESEYTKEVIIEHNVNLKDEMIENILIPAAGELVGEVAGAIADALAEVAVAVIRDITKTGYDFVRNNVLPEIKRKGSELKGKAENAYHIYKDKKHEKKIPVVVTESKVEKAKKERKRRKSKQHTPEEINQILQNMYIAAQYIAAGINELSNTIVVADDPEKKLEVQRRLDALTTSDVMLLIDNMLLDENREHLDQITVQIFEAFKNRELIIQGERVPISRYIA